MIPFAAIQMGVQTLGNVANAYAGYEDAKIEAMNLEEEGRAVIKAAASQAARIRMAGKEDQGSAIAELAANGYDLSQGSANLIINTINQRVEHDAAQSILEGNYRKIAGDYKGTRIKHQAKLALMMSFIPGLGGGGLPSFGGSSGGSSGQTMGVLNAPSANNFDAGSYA